MYRLHIQGLQVRYGGVQALRGIDLQVAEGETVMVTGPNGAGKSTLMKALAGVVKPQAGQIRLGSQDVTGHSPERIATLGLSMVPEGRHVFGGMTVLENLRVAAGQRVDRRQVQADLDALLDVFPILKERAHIAAGLLSGGQQQMLVVARALMTAPTLLAIDEPSLGLAPKVTDQVYEALLRLQAQRQLSLLIVEQSSARVVMTGARMVMLRGGRVVLQGLVQTLDPAAIQAAYFGL